MSKKILKIFFYIFIFLNIENKAIAINIASWSGEYIKSQKLGYGNFFEKKTGQKLNWTNYFGEAITQVVLQKKGLIKKEDNWDIVDVFSQDAILGCQKGIFVKFDFDKDLPLSLDGTPASKDFFAPPVSECAVGNTMFSWNYAFNTDVFSTPPNTIKDFFDTKKFPGKRGIYSKAITNLEIALAADESNFINGGKEIYNQLKTKNGIDRAINKFKKLCEDPKGGCIFWKAGLKPGELLEEKKVVMSTGWNPKLFNAEIYHGAPIKQVWDAQVIDYTYFSLIKGGPNEKQAKAALQIMTSTEGSALISKYISYSPARKSSIKFIEKNKPWFIDSKTKILPYLSISSNNVKSYILLDHNFWMEYNDKINEEWKKFKQKYKNLNND